MRLPVPRTQLYRVRAQQLRDNGLLPNEPIQEGQIRLYQRRYYGLLDDPTDDQGAPYVEVEVPIHVGGEGDLFDGDDYFVFWGSAPAPTTRPSRRRSAARSSPCPTPATSRN